MMWLVNAALRRPLSVAVMAALMLVLGLMSFAYMNVDIFPAINLPVVMMVWNYPGLLIRPNRLGPAQQVIHLPSEPRAMHRRYLMVVDRNGRADLGPPQQP
jgi:hypothetical protein